MDTDRTIKFENMLKKGIVSGTELDDLPSQWVQVAKSIRGPVTEKIEVWPDFPKREPQSSLAGVQPKIGVRKVGEKFTNLLTGSERQERFQLCVDITVELGMYSQKKFEQNSAMTVEQLIEMIHAALPGKSTRENWELTDAEINWILKHLRKLLNTAYSNMKK